MGREFIGSSSQWAKELETLPLMCDGLETWFEALVWEDWREDWQV